MCGDLNVNSMNKTDNKFKMFKDLLDSFEMADNSEAPISIYRTQIGTSITSFD